MRKEAEESITLVNKLKKSQQKVERTRNNALTTLRKEPKAANNHRLEATKDGEELSKDRAETAEVSKHIKAKKDGAL